MLLSCVHPGQRATMLVILLSVFLMIIMRFYSGSIVTYYHILNKYNIKENMNTLGNMKVGEQLKHITETNFRRVPHEF